MTQQPSKFWNIWWTLTLISAMFTILMLLLEGFGILHDWGIALSGIGFVATVLLGLQSATRATVQAMDQRLSQFHETQLHTLRVLERVYALLEQRLPDARKQK